MIYGNMVGAAGRAQTFILQDPDGNEVPAVLVDQETVFDATENDIRAGKLAATERGVTVGAKDIPAYHTTEGIQYIPAGDAFSLSINQYEYTKLQIIICPYNTSMADSVAAEKVCINDGVYAAGSTEVLAEVTTNPATKTIALGITNEGDTPCVMRYFTYKEEP